MNCCLHCGEDWEGRHSCKDGLDALRAEAARLSEALDTQTEHSIALQRLIEALARGGPLPAEVREKAPYHYPKAEMASEAHALAKKVVEAARLLSDDLKVWSHGQYEAYSANHAELLHSLTTYDTAMKAPDAPKETP